jgi:hypothetical protein
LNILLIKSEKNTDLLKTQQHTLLDSTGNLILLNSESISKFFIQNIEQASQYFKIQQGSSNFFAFAEASNQEVKQVTSVDVKQQRRRKQTKPQNLNDNKLKATNKKTICKYIISLIQI